MTETTETETQHHRAKMALRKAVRAAYQLDHLPAQEEVLAIAEKWRPYRSLATSYLFSAAYEPADAPPIAPRET